MQVGVALDAQFFDAPEVDGAGAAIGAVHGVALFEQELGQVGTVLARDASYQCNGVFHVQSG